MIHIDIINASTILTDDQVCAAIPALQKQITSHFYPAWGVNAHLDFVPKGGHPAKGHWWMVIADNSDVAGALGYHDLSSEGLPLGKVFAMTDKQYGLSWTVTLSHELVEMLADPDVNLAAQVSDTEFYAYETADPVEADGLGYDIDGVWVSDFIHPEWFENIQHPKGTKFDHMRHATRPLHILPGGYMSVLRIRTSQGWTQINAKLMGEETYHTDFGKRPKVGSRREKRTLAREDRIKSTIHVHRD